MNIIRRLRQARKLLRLLPNPAFRRGLAHGIAATVEHEGYLASIMPEFVADIGANTGQFALAIRARFPAARIVSFEPLAGPARKYAKLFAGDALTTLHNAAIGPLAETRAIHVSARADSSSLLPIGKLQSQLFPGTEEAGVENVRVAPLDAFVKAEDIPQGSLLKIDVQGFELEALKGCRGLLSRFRWAYVECSFLPLYEGQALADEVLSFLRAEGFAISGIYNLSEDGRGRAVQADFAFERRA